MIDDTDANLSMPDRGSDMARRVTSLPGYRRLEFLESSQHRSNMFIVIDLDRWHVLDLWSVGRASLGTAALDRFKDLLQVVVRCQHPHVLPILDGGVHEGRAFLLAPLVVGRDLRERIGIQPLPVGEAVEPTIALARTVHYVHGSGIVQLDLVTNAVLFRDDGLMLK